MQQRKVSKRKHVMSTMRMCSESSFGFCYLHFFL